MSAARNYDTVNRNRPENPELVLVQRIQLGPGEWLYIDTNQPLQACDGYNILAIIEAGTEACRRVFYVADIRKSPKVDGVRRPFGVVNGDWSAELLVADNSLQLLEAGEGALAGQDELPDRGFKGVHAGGIARIGSAYSDRFSYPPEMQPKHFAVSLPSAASEMACIRNGEHLGVTRVTYMVPAREPELYAGE